MQTVYLDISNMGVAPVIYAKQGDVGRKVEVVLTNSGLPYEPEAGSAFSVWYSGSGGMGNYTDIDGKSAFSVSGNKVTVELITQMLQTGGEGIFCLVLNSANGDQIGLWNIRYMCENVPGAGSAEAKAYYTAFSKAVEGLSNPNLLIESADHPGCYYRFVNDRIEWLNPPMVPGVEYRTTERWYGGVVYTQMFAVDTLPNNASATITVPTNISLYAPLDAAVTVKRKSDGVRYAKFSAVDANLSLAGGILKTSIAATGDMSGYTGYVTVRYVEN